MSFMHSTIEEHETRLREPCEMKLAEFICPKQSALNKESWDSLEKIARDINVVQRFEMNDLMFVLR